MKKSTCPAWPACLGLPLGSNVSRLCVGGHTSALSFLAVLSCAWQLTGTGEKGSGSASLGGSEVTASRILKAWRSSVISPDTKEQVSLAKYSFRAPSNSELPRSVKAEVRGLLGKGSRALCSLAGLVLSGGEGSGATPPCASVWLPRGF